MNFYARAPLTLAVVFLGGFIRKRVARHIAIESAKAIDAAIANTPAKVQE